MSFNILRNADIYNSDSCVHDTRIGYSVDWLVDNDLNGYGLVEGLTSYTVWDGVYTGVSISGSSYIAPESDISVDASLHTIFKVKMRIDIGNHTVQPTTGRIQFQTSSESTWGSDKQVDFSVIADNAYHEYSIDMAADIKWQGSVSRLRVYPFIDGVEGTKVHLKHIKIVSRATFGCDSGQGGAICDKFSEYSHPCPWIGSPGRSKSIVLTDGITIVEDSNDKLLVNINEYGDQAVKLRAISGARIRDIARDIQDKLNLVGVGGYALARVYVEDNRIVIQADTRALDSTVSVGEPQEFSAAKILGFFDSGGIKIAEETTGEAPASRYEVAPCQVNSTALKYLRQPDRTSTQSSFVIDPSMYSPQGGNAAYRTTIQDGTLDFRNQTIIDYDNPINQNGLLSLVAFSGDSYSNTAFRIYRQKLDGSMDLVSSISMSSVSDNEDRVFEKSVLVRVRKGDFLGLYSAALHTGKSIARPNFSYILYEGDLISGTAIQALSGRGEGGLPLFARGSRKADQALLEAEFEDVEPIESISVRASQEAVSEEINLCTGRSGGLGGGPYVTGVTGLDSEGNQAPQLQNLSSLIDGVKQDINQDSSVCYPSWLDLPDQQDKYDFTDFQIEFDFAKGIDVFFDIHRINMYFVVDKNVKNFRWEIPIATNLEDTIRIWGIGWTRYNQVFLDNGLADSGDSYLYDNPAVVTASNYQVAHEFTRYKELKLLFSPYSARSIRYNVILGESLNTDETSRLYSSFPLAPNPRIQEIEVYSVSTPISNITSNFSFESSETGALYLLHQDSDSISTTKAKYIIGKPIRFLRINIASDSPMKIFDIFGSLSEDPLKVTTNYKDIVNLNTPVDVASTIEEIVITNESLDTSNFFVDILAEAFKVEKCILWNKLGSDTEVKESEIGPGGIVRRREPFYLRPYNYAYKCPAYFLDKNFISSQPAYISLDNLNTWQNIGSTIADGSHTHYVTNENVLWHVYPFVYVALDLGQVFDVESITMYSPLGAQEFFDNILYSGKDVSDPALVDDWSISNKSSARWARFVAPSVVVGSPDMRKLSYVEVDLTLTSTTNRGKLPWVSAGGNLTNGTSGYTTVGQEEGWIVDGQSDYFCVDLGWWQNLTNVIVGPFTSGADSIEDIDIIEPGDYPSIVDSTGVGSNVAYSSSASSDPSRVIWSNFGTVPSDNVRWVLVRAVGSRVEEIIVHVNENQQNSKVSNLDSKWWSAGSGSVYNEYVETKSGLIAASLDYSQNIGPTNEYMLFRQSLGIDFELAKRDVLAFWFFITDVSQLDNSYGYFELGRSSSQTNIPLNINLTQDTSVYYRWAMADIHLQLEDGWNYLQLPFSDNFKTGNIFFASDNRDFSDRYNIRDRITNFKLVFRGVSSNDAFTIRIDDLRLLRRHYDSCKFDDGTYLPAKEYLKFPLNGFDPVKGTIEFFIKADWTKSPACNSCDDPREHTIFRVYGSEDDSMFGLFMAGTGLRFYVTDGDKDIFLTDNTSNVIQPDRTTHVAVTWDFEGAYGDLAMAIYIEGILSQAFKKSHLDQVLYTPTFSQQNLYTLLFGGLAWAGIISKFASSVDGVIDNVRVYNYPISDFTDSLVNATPRQANRSSE